MNKYQKVSRIIGILMRIANVFCWIGVVGMAIGTVATAIIAPNVKIDSDAKEIKIFDKTSSYTLNGKDLEVGEGDEKVIIRNNEIKVGGENGSVVSVKLTDGDVEKLEEFVEKDLSGIIAAAPYALALATVATVFATLALGHGARVFKNIATEESPFTEENVERSEKSFKYLFIAVVIEFFVGMIVSAVTKGNTTVAIGTSIGTLLTLYVSIYILKSGLENKPSKKKSKEEE